MKQNSKILIIPSVFAIFFAFFIFNPRTDNSDTVSILGEKYQISKEVKKVLALPVMQRLKEIDQSGPARYFGTRLPGFSRYEHSIGVWAILKKTGASLKEQVAGVLHDSSHTVFSHVGDFIFAKNINDFNEKSYQDNIHIKYLKNNNVCNIVRSFNITYQDLNPENEDYKRLEQPLPDMCADRIQYNIYTGVLLKVISKEEAKNIFDDIKFEDGKWFFTNKELAKKFAELSLYFTQNFWGSKWNMSLNIHLANALKRALKLKVITEQDLFLTDDIVMKKINKNQDPIIQINIQQCKTPLEKIPDKSYKSIFCTPKFRGIDPLIKQEGSKKIVRLSQLDKMFEHYYSTVKEWCKNGFYIYVLS